MEDEPKKQSDEIQGILSDLDDILSGLGAHPESAPKPAEPAKPAAAAPPATPQKPAETPKPVEAAKPAEPPAPKPVEPPKPVELPKPVEAVKPPAPPPAPTPAPATADDLKIELAPRAGSMPAPKKAEAPKPPEPPKPHASDAKPPLEIPAMGAPAPAPAPKPVEPPKAAEPPKPVEPPKPAEPPKPVEAAKPPEAPKPVEPPKAVPPPEPAKPAAAAPAAAPAAAGAPVVEDIPATAAKDQIRRVAYIHTFACTEPRAAFAAFLSQAARTISKKPLYLRQVLDLEVDGVSDPNAIFEKARAAKAVAVLAVLEGWPPAKVDALEEACSRGGLLFRSIAPGEVQKKSTAVDVIVDMMLLPGEG